MQRQQIIGSRRLLSQATNPQPYYSFFSQFLTWRHSSPDLLDSAPTRMGTNPKTLMSSLNQPHIAIDRYLVPSQCLATSAEPESGAQKMSFDTFRA